MMANIGQFVEKVPPISTLLATGMPTIAALDMYIADLDVDLEENAKELDSCLKDMLKLTNTIVGKEYVTPRDALLSMISTHRLETDSCYDPDPNAVTDILAHAAYMLDQVPGSEEAVFQDLLSLSSEQGLSLPLKSSGVDPVSSTLSLNAVSDNSELQIAQQWDQIALRLRRYFQDRLLNLPVSPTPWEIDLYEKRRLKYLQSLMTLQPAQEVLDRYQVIRHQQLERCLSMLMPDGESENLDILTISKHCTEIAKVIIQMMNEDFMVFNMGIMKKPANIFHAFQKMYLEKFSDEMAALVDEVLDDVRDSVKREPSGSLGAQSLKRKSKAIKQGFSPLQQSQSVDNIARQEGDSAELATEGTVIPSRYIKVMLNIVESLQEIEEHMDGLQHAAYWDVGGIATKKTQRKGSLKGVLKPSSSPELGRRPHSASMSVDVDSWMSDSQSSVTSSMMFEAPAGPKVTVVEKTKMEEKIRWDWKFIFKRVALDLAASIKNNIQVTMATSLEAELKQWTADHTVTTVTLKPSQWGGRLDYPKVVSKATYDFVEELETNLAFANSGKDGVLSKVRENFVDCANTCLKNMHTHLSKLSVDIPHQAPMKALYIFLASAAYIRNHLLHFDTVLAQDESKRPFSLQYKQFVELVENLTDQLIQRHNNYIATSVLHDIDSHNWTETKEFYEGERCTFPVQMWYFYMRGMQYDMWSICPPKLAQTSLAVILHDSLQILTQRYTQAKPSFRRIGTFCCDIKTMLLCVSEMLYSCSNSISRCIDVGHSQIPHHSIHNLCTALLSTMAIVGSPLEVLYKVNKKGYRYRQKRKSLNQTDRGSNCNWLHWIQPTLIEKGVKSYDGMRTTTALYLHTKHLLSQPEVNFPLTLQAYLMKDFTLSILFLTQMTTLCYSEPDHNAQGKVMMVGGEGMSPSHVKYIHQQEAVSEKGVRDFTISLFRILIQTTEFRDGLAKVVIPVIDRCDHWACLDVRHVPGKDLIIPVWMDGIFYCLRPFVQRVLGPMLDFVLTRSESKQITPISVAIEELPCGCRTQAPSVTPRSSRKSEANKDTVDSVLRLVLNQISEDMFVLPANVCVLFKALEAQTVVKGLKTPHHSVGTKLIGLALRQYLLDTDQLAEVLGLSLSPAIIEELKLLAECVYHVLVSGKVKGSSTPRLAGRFCKDNKDWINDKVQILVFYLNSEIFDVGDTSLHKEGTTEFLDQMYLSLASDILSTNHGLEDLTKLYWLLHNNSEWLYGQLDIKHALPLVERVPGAESFRLNVASRSELPFNPIKEHQCIGPYKFDHGAIEALPVEWEKLLQSDLGLSELGFRTLLYNRHEMQDGAYLEENEKKPVASLRSIFENDPRELR